MAETTDWRNAVQRELEALTRARDELRVRIHLAKADARDEWKKLESTWQRVQEEFRRASEHGKSPVREMGTALRTLIDELKQSYARIREQLKEPRKEDEHQATKEAHN